MDNKAATPLYYRLVHHLARWAGNAQVHVVRAKDAGAIFLSGREWGHYHLSYRMPNAHNTAMHAIFALAVPILTKAGCQRIHLGGGRTGEITDSLYRFKSTIGRLEHQVYFQSVP